MEKIDKTKEQMFLEFKEALTMAFNDETWSLDCKINEFKTDLKLKKTGIIYHFEYGKEKAEIADINAKIQSIANEYELEIKIQDEKIEMFSPDQLEYTATLMVVRPLDIIKIRPGQLFVVDGHMYCISNVTNADQMPGNLGNGQNIYQFNLMNEK